MIGFSPRLYNGKRWALLRPPQGSRLEARKHEKGGIELYARFLAEANDERGREMYRKLLEEERWHIRMLEEEIEEHKKQGHGD